MNNRYLTFFLGEELYGIDISKVKEIIAMMKITRVPKSHHYIKGVINLRGSIIPVIDTRLRFDIDMAEYGIETAIIIIEIQKINIGFIVDKVEEVMEIESDDTLPKFGFNIDIEFIKSIGRVRDMIVMILDIEKIFESEEIQNFDRREI
jgi:purine-binding chemotaxis protein CheW